MAINKRTKAQREGDLARIAELYLSGTKQADIAATLGVSQPQISYELKKLQKRWAASAIRNLDAAKGEELAKIDNLELEYWACWRKSGGEVKSKSVEREKIVLDEENKIHKGAAGLAQVGAEGVKEGEIVRTIERSEIRIGETKFLDGVQWCIERRCKLLGIDVPAKASITGDILAAYINVDFGKI